ncbi:MAG: hypothetical protein DHS20C05_20860 [Hyphococcus sp.]|nr:MAG: hypothetical protein DHS20C05_20860 [Marinicaulis sp.]
MIWVFIALISTAVLAFLVQPFFSKKAEGNSVRDRDYLIAQIKELEAQHGRQNMAEEEADAALLEARRRLLEAETDAEGQTKKSVNSFLRHASVILIALMPVAAVGLYMATGNPNLSPSSHSPKDTNVGTIQPPQDINDMSPEDRAAMIETMVEGLAARLEESPDDLEGWLMLARSYGVQGELQKSADAYGRAAALAPDNLDIRVAHLQSELSMMDLRAPHITEPMLSALLQVERLDAEHPLALYFLGQAAAETGEPEQARQYWERLEVTMPPGSDAALSLRKMIDAL